VRGATKDDIIHVNLNKYEISDMVKSKEDLIYTPHNIPML
jgi:hypothetical protein